MSFIKAITRKGRTVVRRTRDMAEIVAICGKLAVGKGRIRQRMRDIGQQYVQIHGQDAEDPLADLVGQVQDLQALQEERHGQIRALCYK